MRLKLYDRDEDRSWWKPFRTDVADVDRADPLEHQLAHFCAVIRGEAKPLVTARDGLQNLRVTEAIALATRTGQPFPSKATARPHENRTGGSWTTSTRIREAA